MKHVPSFKAFSGYLKERKVALDLQEFEFQLESHPEYPSMLSFCDCLTFFNVEHTAARVSFSEIEDLPVSFLAVIENNLAHITRERDSYIVNGKKLSKSDFGLLWKEIVLLIDDDETQANKSGNEIKKTSVVNYLVAIVSAFAISYFLIVNSVSVAIIGSFVLAFAGLILSIEVFRQMHGLDSIISDGFCSSFAKADCKSVLTSAKWQWLKRVSLPDVCIVFFVSQMASVLLFTVFGSFDKLYALTRIGIWLVIPVSLISIYFQARIEKQWCPLCLSIIAVLYGELFLTNLLSSDSSWQGAYYNTALGVLTVVFFVTTTWVPTKKFYLSVNTLRQSEKKYLRLKRNYRLFSLELTDQPRIVGGDIDGALVFGNVEAKIGIDFVTNPFCGYCKDMHTVIGSIIEEYGDKLSVRLRFNRDPELVGLESEVVFHNLIRIYQEKGQEEFLFAMEEWFVYKEVNRDYWIKKYSGTVDYKVTESVLLQQWNWVMVNGRNFTPSINIARYPFPVHFDRLDLEYFIPDLLEDERLAEEKKLNVLIIK